MDLWQQWQLYGARFAAGAPFASGWPGQQDATPENPLGNQFERFAAALRALGGSLAAGSVNPAAGAGRGFADALRTLFGDLPSWANPGIGSSPLPPAPQWDAPALGPNREHQLRYQRMASAWHRALDAQRVLQNLWADALREAAMAFAAKLDLAQLATPTPESLYKIYGQWIDQLEDAYAQMAHSEAYCAALAGAVNAGSDWRCEVHETIEQSAKLLDLPTRSELNALMQRIQQLEVELRAAKSAAAPPASSPKRGARPASPAKRSARRRKGL
jgi:Poly(R)-hydroxyalkanoic acid synthase subunit (PHA_synth_III_E)